jgi:VanZ like family
MFRACFCEPFISRPDERMKQFLKYWLPLPIWLALMFVGSTDLFSAEHTSRFIVPMLLWLKPGMSPLTIRAIMFGLRKCAHVCEYAVLALLLWRALRSSPRLRTKLATLTGLVVVSCAAFAASDEFHQTFVKSRTASVRDVFLDISGAVLGLLIGMSFAFCRRRKAGSIADAEFVNARL